MGDGLDREMQRVFLAIVPVTNFIKVEESAIVAGDLADLASPLLDLPKAIVLTLEHVGSKVDRSRQVILLVTERLLFGDLMAESSHEEAVDFVSRRIKGDTAAITEPNLALPDVFHLSGLETGADDPLHGARNLIIFVIKLHVRDRWVVRNLLHIDHSSILASCLESFAKDWIKRLLKAFIVNDSRHACTYNHFQAFEGFLRQISRFGHIGWHCTKVLCNYNKCCFWGHAPDRETDACQVKISAENLAAGRLFLYNMMDKSSQNLVQRNIFMKITNLQSPFLI